jgi:hypothetical protein
VNFSAGEVRGVAHVSDLHPDATLTVTIALDNGIGWLTVTVPASGPRSEPHHYIVSPLGRVWHTNDGTPKGRVEPPIREPDLDHALPTPIDKPGHVQELIDHLACLDDEQTEQVRAKLNAWKKAARARDKRT